MSSAAYQRWERRLSRVRRVVIRSLQAPWGPWGLLDALGARIYRRGNRTQCGSFMVGNGDVSRRCERRPSRDPDGDGRGPRACGEEPGGIACAALHAWAWCVRSDKRAFCLTNALGGKVPHGRRRQGAHARARGGGAGALGPARQDDPASAQGLQSVALGAGGAIRRREIDHQPDRAATRPTRRWPRSGGSARRSTSRSSACWPPSTTSPSSRSRRAPTRRSWSPTTARCACPSSVGSRPSSGCNGTTSASDPGGVLDSDAHQRGSVEHLSVLEGEFEVEVAGVVPGAAPARRLRYRCRTAAHACAAFGRRARPRHHESASL